MPHHNYDMGIASALDVLQMQKLYAIIGEL